MLGDARRRELVRLLDERDEVRRGRLPYREAWLVHAALPMMDDADVVDADDGRVAPGRLHDVAMDALVDPR